MKKALFGTALLFVVSALAGGALWWSSSNPTSQIEDRVRHVLNDPSSAEFKAVEYNKRHGTGCGFVNARNRMGGMVGYTAFIAHPDGEVRFQPPTGQPEWSGWFSQAKIYCDASGKATPFWQMLMNDPG